ncbi:hypothetical protein ENSA7_24850 [Enhygromyxa salina]|uniref:Uncharacterized protein n=1 Tax=Enhygromyxa salina TaxID=215803 RepID=A0A2S9YRT9_9BACT|nr:hypothetical protein ENSA7_24850 [Enhygromyxa salina]
MECIEAPLLMRVGPIDTDRGEALAHALIDPRWPLARDTCASRSAAHRDELELVEIRDRRDHVIELA